MVKKSVTLKFTLISLFFVLICIYIAFKSNITLTDDVTMSIVCIENGSIELSIANHSGFLIEYSSSYELEQHSIGGWYRISLLPKGGNLLSYSLLNDELSFISIKYESSYPNLRPGRYRIVKEISVSGYNKFIGSEFFLD